MPTYKTVPFSPSIKEKEATKEGAALIARQMGEIINGEARDGWSFQSFETVEVSVFHGCLAALAGKGSSTVHYGVLVFTREP